MERKRTLLSARELCKQTKDLEWRIKMGTLGIAPKGALGLLAAEPEAFKSLGLLSLGIGATTGDWLGTFQIDPCRVIYYDRENGDSLIKARLTKLSKGAGLDEIPEKLFVDPWPEWKMLDAESLKTLESDIDEKDAKIVLFDSFVDFFGGDENKASDVNAALGALNEIAKRKNVLILGLHHMNKPNYRYKVPLKHRVRGHTDIVAKCDLVLGLTRESDDTAKLHFIKSRSAKKPQRPVVIRILDNADETATTVRAIGAPKIQARVKKFTATELLDSMLDIGSVCYQSVKARASEFGGIKNAALREFALRRTTGLLVPDLNFRQEGIGHRHRTYWKRAA